jgi:acyl-CoA thioester hydrolase
MPLKYTRSFRVRYSECDPYGHLNNANYLRFMQETASDASTAAGYGEARYSEMGRVWLIRASAVEYLCPLRPHDRVEVTTWIADFRRVSSRRRYEFRLATPSSGDPHAQTPACDPGAGASQKPLVASAYTDWVFLDAATGQPASIPEQLGRDFFPEGVPASFPTRKPFPAASPPPPGAFCMRREVNWSDLDMLRHVTNAVYMNYVTDCGFQALAACGWPWMRLAERGIGVYIRRNHIQYFQPALPGDALHVTTWASNVRRSTAERHYTIRRAGDETLLAQAWTLSVWVSLETGQPVRIPKDFLADFKGFISDQPHS